MAKKSNKGWIIGIVVVVIIILLLLYGRKAPEAPPEEAPPAEAPPAEAPPEVAPPAEEAPAEEAPAEEAVEEEAAPPEVKPSEVEVTEEQTSVGVQGQETIEEKSWFSGIKCQYGANEEAGTRYDDLLTFQFTNHNTKPYHIGYVKVMEQTEKNALRLSINGHGLRKEAVEACGGVEVVQPGQTIECTVTADLRESEDMVMGYGEEQINILQGDSKSMTTRTYFKC